MERVIEAIATVLPFALLAISLWLMFTAYNDLLHRQVPNRLVWAFLILVFPIFGALLYLMTFRDRV